MQTRTYNSAGTTADELGGRVRAWFAENRYETQSFRLPAGGLVVQGFRDDIWRVAIGLAAALTVQIRELPGEVIEVTVGAGAWGDKLIVAGIGLLFFYPLVLPAAWGTFQQYQLDREIWQVIDSALPGGVTTAPPAGETEVSAEEFLSGAEVGVGTSTVATTSDPVAPATTVVATTTSTTSLPTEWFNEQTGEVYAVQFFQRMESWQRAIADGRIEPAELETQSERVTGLLRNLDTTVSDEVHTKLTRAFGELAVLQGMQSYAMLQHIGGSGPVSGPTPRPVEQ